MADRPDGTAIPADALHGLRVLEFSQVWAGPACGEILGDFGADVIKVEATSRPDIARTMGPFPGGEADLDASGYFLEWNRNKRSVDLDLRDPADVATALDLAADADVVLENFAPGVLDRLGLSYGTIAARNPAVVMASISGYGASGPDGRTVAYGQQIEAESGLMSITGYTDGAPLKPGAAWADIVVAITAVIEIMGALRERMRTGRGRWLDLSMLEATTALMSEPMSSFRATGHSPGPAGNGSPWFAPHGIYACAGEDRWIAIECREEADWGALLTVLGAEKLADDRRFATLARRLEHVAELDCQIGGRTRERERHELAEELQDAGVAAVPVLDVADLFADPHLAERGWWIDFDQPGLGRFRAHGPIARLERTPARLRLRPPQLGEHTAELKPVRS